MEPKLDLSNLTLEKLVTAAQEAFAKERKKQAAGHVIIAPPRVTIREKIDLIAKDDEGSGTVLLSRALLNQVPPAWRSW